MLKKMIDVVTAGLCRITVRPVVTASLCYIAGCVAEYPYKGLPPNCIKVIFGVLLSISFIILKKKSVITVSGDTIPLLLKSYEIKNKINRMLRFAYICSLPLFFVCGIWRMSETLNESSYEEYVASPVSKLKEMHLSGRVGDIEKSEYSLKVTIEEAIADNGSVEMYGGKILVYVPFEYESEFECTDSVKLKGFAKEFKTATNEGEFDEKSYYRAKGYSSSFEADAIIEVHKNDDLISNTKKILYSFKTRINARVNELFVGDSGEFVSAVLLGEKSGITTEIKELYNKAGIGHLLSISGLHISLVGMLLIKMLKKLGVGRAFSGFAGMIIVFCYCCMTGFGVSSKRAFVMFCMATVSVVIFKSYDIFSGLAFAAILILYKNPLELFETSFLLSFSATIGIAVFINESCIWKKHIKAAWIKRVIDIAGGGIFVQLSTLPVMLWAFSEVSVLSFFINLIVIPLFTYVVLFSATGIAVSYLWLEAGGFLCGFVHYVIEVYNVLCELALKMPHSRWCPGKPEGSQIVLYYIALTVIILLIRNRIGKEKKSFLGIQLGILMLIPVLLVRGGNNYFKVCFLDVGQGECIYFTGKGIDCLVDCGSTSEKGIDKRVIIPFLKTEGVCELDYLFLTHSDFDHVSGAEGVLTSDIKVKNLVIPYTQNAKEEFAEIIEVASENHTKVYYISQGNSISKGNVSIRCLHPDGTNIEDKNEGSIVMLLSFKEFDALLTGDIGSDTEKKILKRGIIEDSTEIELLKCAHHGSKYSNCEEFVSILRPMMAVVSCSVDNSYGHPHLETIERLQAAGAYMYYTKDSGQISVVTDGKTIKVSSFIP